MPIPDKFHHYIQKLIEQQNPQSLEEMEKLLDSITGMRIDDLVLPSESLTPQDHAREMVWKAQEMPEEEGKRLVQLALETDPDCIEAYEYFAFSETDVQKRFDYLIEGVKIGQRLFGGEFLEANDGHFWGITETRPYMRCLAGIAECYEAVGQIKEAINVQEEMLSLNTNDNQGMRYPYMSNLLFVGDFEKYHEYRKEYDEDGAMMYYNDALVAFLETGETGDANPLLFAAFASNKYVPDLILAPAPSNFSPDSYTLNSREEAIIYTQLAGKAWHASKEALDWLERRWAIEKPNLEKLSPAKPLLPAEVKPGEALFSYLSPSGVRETVFNPLTPASLLQLRPGLKPEDVKDARFLRLVRHLLLEIKEAQPLKLTQKGNLPRTVVRKLYDCRIFTSDYVDNGTIKLLGELDFTPIHLAHVLSKMASLVKKRNNKLSLTKTGEKMLEDDAALYTTLLNIYTSKLNWAYIDNDAENVAQWGWAYSMLLFLAYGDKERETSFYADQYKLISPDLPKMFRESPYFDSNSQFQHCFNFRFFATFCDYFGLAEIRKEKNEKGYTSAYYVKKTELADKVFMECY